MHDLIAEALLHPLSNISTYMPVSWEEDKMEGIFNHSAFSIVLL
jgi:hypothetical protein